MVELVEGFHAGEQCISEANGQLSRENIVVAMGQNLPVAAVITQEKIGDVTSVAGANTGDGVMGVVVAKSDVIIGDYVVTITAVNANAGDFELKDPNSVLVATGTVGIPLITNHLDFTLADGAADFIVNDDFTLSVVAGSGEYSEYISGGRADGILFDAVDATAAAANGVAHVRVCEVHRPILGWKTGLVQLDMDAAEADLLKNLIRVRD